MGLFDNNLSTIRNDLFGSIDNDCTYACILDNWRFWGTKFDAMWQRKFIM